MTVLRITVLKTNKYDSKWIKMDFGSFDRPVARRYWWVSRVLGDDQNKRMPLVMNSWDKRGICKWALSNFFSSMMDLLIWKYHKFWQRGTVDYLMLRWPFRTLGVFFKLFSLSQYQRNLYWVMLVRNSNTFFWLIS